MQSRKPVNSKSFRVTSLLLPMSSSTASTSRFKFVESSVVRVLVTDSEKSYTICKHSISQDIRIVTILSDFNMSAVFAFEYSNETEHTELLVDCLCLNVHMQDAVYTIHSSIRGNNFHSTNHLQVKFPLQSMSENIAKHVDIICKVNDL
jgi:hypothetical protein